MARGFTVIGTRKGKRTRSVFLRGKTRPRLVFGTRREAIIIRKFLRANRKFPKGTQLRIKKI